MGQPARRLATHADLWDVPDTMVGEILAGELQMLPRPLPRHAFAQSSLSGEISSPFQKGRGGPGGWIFLCEPELHLRDDVLVPDLAGWRRERLPAVPESAALDLAPDWVCEILSPRTEALDRGLKAQIYAREGVRWYWLLNPRTHTLEVWRLEQGRWLVLDFHQGDAAIRAEPFDAVPIELGALWAPGPESPLEP